MAFMDKLKKFTVVKSFIGFLLVGLIFTAIGAFIIFSPKSEKVTVEATIDRIEEYIEFGETQHRIYISYTDANGVKHENVPHGEYSSKMKEGDTLSVQYDVNDPECVSSTGGEFLPYVITGIGILCIVGSLVFGIKALKKPTSEYNQFDKVDKAAIDPITVEELENSTEPKNDYVFHFTGKLNQSYIMETATGRTPVFEAKCEKAPLIKPGKYTFVNHISMYSSEKEITNTVTKSYGNGGGAMSYSIPVSSSFKINGVNNWIYLGEMGYSLEPHISGLKMCFDVLKYGVKVAYFESAGANALKDGATNPLGNIPGVGIFKVNCRESDVEGVFTACFCASRVEFF